MTERPSLPIDGSLDAIARAVAAKPAVLVQATPGAGKTTRVPPALLAAVEGRIIVLEPRRLAARLSAERIAAETGTPLGELVGYQIRFDAKVTAKTRLVFVTEGVFLRMALDDPELKGVGAVVIDEFHERHIHTDLALALVRRLQKGRRPDLRLVVMSATLDAGPLATYLAGAETFAVEGRTFPVAIEHRAMGDEGDVLAALPGAVQAITADPRCEGDVLVFLTGAAEIRRAAGALQTLAQTRGFDVLPLSAELPGRDQMRVFAPSPRRKVILATNVAETSLTIPGVTGVIDAGRAKIAGHAAWSGMPTLDVKRVSQASCIQRAGRAGRVRPGVCYRLFSENDFLGRSPFTPPDIQRLDFASTLLELLALKQATSDTWATVEEALPWFETPKREAVEAAAALLRLLGVMDETRFDLTPFGLRVAKLPLHPRLGAMVAAGIEKGLGSAAILAAALVSEGMLLSRGQQAAERASCDLLLQIDVYDQMRRGGRGFTRAMEAAIDRGRYASIQSLHESMARRLSVPPALDPAAIDPRVFEAIVLAGFPDRVARRIKMGERPGDRPVYNFCLGRGGTLAHGSSVHDRELIIALDASESQGMSKDKGTSIWTAAGVSLETLQQGPARFVEKKQETVWQADAERVDVMRRTYYGQIWISETRTPPGPDEAMAVEEILREKLAERWPKPFEDDSDLATYHERVRLLGAHGDASAYPRFEGDMLELLLATICEGKRSFKEIAARSLVEYIHDQLPYEQRRDLEAAFPAEVKLGSGRTMKVHYEAGKPPYVAGFIQDFYGTKATPALVGGRLKLTVHLWAPNRRPVQVTGDLEGFWQNHYPALKQELGRNYPRHYWPDDPRVAQPVLHKARVGK